MKKVLAIAPYPYLPFFSGGQKFIAQFFEHLGAVIDLTVISVADNDFSLAKSYKTIPLLKKSFSRYFDRSLISKITTLTKQEGFDTIICEHPYFAWLAFAVKKRTGVKVIIHTHNIEYQRFRSTGRWWWPVLKRYEKRSFEKADKIFFITPVDRQFATETWKIPPEKCIDVPFGVDIKAFSDDKATQRGIIAQRHGIEPDEKIILFNGLLSYKPNLDAVKHIIAFTNIVLRGHPGFRYKIVISGKGLPAKVEEFLKGPEGKNIIYTGFVDDIIPYFKAADIFLNPVQSGGGIKTKMVEAIAYGTTVVAYESAAAGIVKKACGKKLVLVPDQDWKGFASAVIENANDVAVTPEEYYDYYFYGNIIKRLMKTL